MTPSILIIGATGNTGQSLTEALPKLLKTSKTLSTHRVLVLTRNPSSSAATKLSQIPNVEVLEKNWVEITPSWLRSYNVTRAFIASHNEPTQFAEESTFHTAALTAGVEYVVRVSTTAANVRPDCLAYYPRSHWAIEALLDSREFGGLKWSSLQPNIFSTMYLSAAAEFVRKHRDGEPQSSLRLLANEDAPVGIIDPADVGLVAARLLAEDDVSSHDRARYVLNGPLDITGRQIVDMVEEYIGVKVENVCYKDLSFLEDLYDAKYAATNQSRNVIFSIKYAPDTAWEGKCSAETTSPEVLKLAAPKRTPADVFRDLVEGL
ncbi:hypothetical protein N7532_001573 [Penicillium argentinense]|uniref:NmrA-like domain-containing protein n=1 Tax=Penicillium argentinense TaxID=1131581 RepID=A0A9W9G2V0_9EURO|nr:uncharacterized protein N7532_001573 [Penicillium argentinense]KAJ5111038.1 hypothetical protein N7532_001573 [Penicillium argentinense]